MHDEDVVIHSVTLYTVARHMALYFDTISLRVRGTVG
jgi:hypothetical protein